MLYISIALTLLTLMAGMLLLNKTKKEGLGKFFAWVSYVVIVISILLLLCQLTRGIMRMTCCRGMHDGPGRCMMQKDCCRDGGMMMMMHGCMNGGGRCMEEMRECKMKGDSASCKPGMMHGCPMGEKNEEKDSVKK